MKKSFSIVLCLALMLQVVILGTFSTSATTPADECKDLSFLENFDNDIFFTPADDEIYVTEMPHWGNGKSQGNDGWDKATSPEVQNDGSLLFDQYDGLSLYWENIDGFELSADKVYTITFDVDILSKGDGTLVRPGGWNRELYFGYGGYYNQVEFRSKAFENKFGILAGGTNGTWTYEDYELGTYSITVVWNPEQQTVVSTVKCGEDLISQGTRSGGQYAVTDAHAKLWTWRCEGGSFKLSNVVINDGTNDFEADFANEFVNKDELLAKTNWLVEGQDYGTKNSATIPTVENGMLKLDTYDSVTFNWKRMLDKAGLAYNNSTATYTFEFDARVTNSGVLGNGTWDNNPAHTGVLYVALGGWFDQIRINTNVGKVYAGGSNTASYSEDTYLNQWVHISLSLTGANATSVITDAEGNVLASGTRNNSSYTENTDHMLSVALRCEDGAIDIDNFTFVVDDSNVHTDHTPDEDKRQDPVAPDCGNEGNSGNTVCKVCGAEILSETIPATGNHNYGEWNEGTAANCMNTGILGHYQCRVCEKYFDAEYQEMATIIDPVNDVHAYDPENDWIPEDPATCTEGGTVGHYHCDRCNGDFDANGTVLNGLDIPAGHNYGEWIPEDPATCTENGMSGHYYCVDCETYFDDQYEVVDVADLTIECGHTCGEWVKAEDATCTENGHVGYYYCSVCEEYLDENYEVIDDIVIPTGHTYGDIIPEVPANCTEKGTVAHYNCSACNKDFDADKNEITDLAIAEKGHTFGEWTVTKEATVDAVGEKKRECANCDHFETEEIAKLEPTTTPEADKNEGGNNNANDDANTNTDTATDANTDTSADNNQATEPATSGCGASIAATAVAVVTVLGLGVTALKKRED